VAFLDSITNQIQGIINVFTGGSTQYAVRKNGFGALINEIEPSKWNQNLPYSFQVEDGDRINALRDFRNLYNEQRERGGNEGIESVFGSLTSALMSMTDIGKKLSGINKRTEQTDRKHFSELTLQINPSELQQDENFAVNITPTQDGTVVEHNGIVFKDLTISGTTGVFPLRGASGVIKSFSGGRPITAANPDAKSGYEHFQEIRNYFKAYAEAKRKAKNRSLVLLFKNRKDNETLIVEPLKFSMKKSASSPFLYNYTIQMKVLKAIEPIPDREGPFSFLKKIEEVSQTVKDKLDTARGVLLQSQSLLKTIESEIDTVFFEPFRKFSMVLNDTVGLAQTLADLPGNIKNNFNQSVIAAFNNATSLLPRISGVMGLVPNIQKNKALSSAQSMSPTEIQNQTSMIADDIVMTQLDAEETVTPDLQAQIDEEVERVNQLPRSFYEDLLETTNKLRDDAAEKFNLNTDEYNTYAGRVNTFDVASFKQPTNEEILILYGLDQAAGALELFLTTDTVSESLEEKATNAEERFRNNVSITNSSSAYEVIIEYKQTLEDIATIELGSPNYWPDLAILNNLKPPYIQEEETDDPRIKNYGDVLLVPSEDDSFSGGTIDLKDTKINKNLNNLQKQMGIDVKLTENYDFSFNNIGDVNLIAGAENAGQAIVIKLTLEKGDLRYHPELGLDTEVGEKLKDPLLLKDQIIKSLQQDPRFEEVKNVNFRVDGNTVYIDMEIKLKDSAVPITITI